jgi:rhodanese-related sulfurtransferase
VSVSVIAPDALVTLVIGTLPHAVLDLRERGAYERGHIFGTTSLPRRLIEQRLPQLVTARRTPVVLCDEDGALTELAAPTLVDLGYSDVRALAGGLAGWRAARRPVVQGVNLPSKVFGERVLHACGTPQIAPAELQARIDRGDDLLIVDARTPEEYQRGCIPGAWSVPGGDLILRVADLIGSPETTIIVHCGGRTRSYIGAETLRRMSLPNPVRSLENGTMGWELAGLALERAASRWAPPPSTPSRAAAGRVARRIAAEDGLSLLTVEALRQLLDRRDHENVIVLDVRARAEYEAGHLPGSIWAPGGQAIQATDDYIAVRAGSIVCVCDDAVRSTITASWLRRMALPSIHVLAGGLAAWTGAGGDLESGSGRAPIAGFEKARHAMALVGPEGLRRELEHRPGLVLLNVDRSDDYARGHVPGAGWLCRSRLELRIEACAPGRGAPLVVSCADGVASTLAAAALVRLGYTAVRVLEGGTGAWERAGFPVERGASRLLDEPDDVVLKPYDRGRPGMQAYLDWETALGEDGRSPYSLFPPPGG